MITYAAALDLISTLAPQQRTVRRPLEDCEGHRLAEDLIAKIPSPPYSNSAMDGFAVRRAEAEAGPLTISATIYARPVEPSDIPPARDGACVRIMTGGYLPEWADTVIPVEQSVIGADGRVSFTALSELGANIRRRGDDFEAGGLLLKAGAELLPERLMVAAAFGHRDLAVTLPPHLHLFSTGDELVEPGESLAPGALYNSSKYFLLAAARRAGIAPSSHRTLADDERAAADAIRPILDAGEPAVILTTGAVSAGEADFIPKLAERLGFEALLHRVAIRPGKPVFLARRGAVTWLGLPGNAISTAVGWHAFARPLLAQVAGLPPPPKGTLLLANEVKKPEGLRCFFRAEVNGGRAWVARRQGSAELAASAANTAYVELPEGLTKVPVDTKVDAFFV
jgi:molybdopterin molybdotransferase